MTSVGSRDAMAQLTAVNGDSCVLTEQGREGFFVFSSANHWSGVVPPIGGASRNASVTAEPDGSFLVLKTANTNAYDCLASNETIPLPGNFELVASSVYGQDQWLAGVSANPTSLNYSDIDFAISLGGISVYSYVNGTGAGMANRPWSIDLATEKAFLRRVNGVITNGTISSSGVYTVMQTYPGTSTQTLYLHLLLYKAHTSITVKLTDLTSVGTGLVQADPRQGVYVAAGSDPLGRNGAWVRLRENELCARWFGASSGASADVNTAALGSASSLLCHLGGGRLELEPDAVYTVGRQTQSRPAEFAYAPDKILYFSGFDGDITLEGNGATLKLAAGLRYGSFDPATGARYDPSLPFADRTYLASPAEGVIFAEKFAGSLTVQNLRIDGNIQNLTVGGNFGDTGWQVMHAGLQILAPGKVTLRNVQVRNVGTDGCTYQALVPEKGSSPIPLLVENCSFEKNGRQGFSFAGGRGATFVNCRFSETGKNGVIDSNPHAGFDMEPDGGNYARDIAFMNCHFLNNAGAGYIADSGRTQDILFDGCWFSGDTSYATWISKPGHVIRDSRIVGVFMDASVTNLANPYEEGRATQYLGCVFTDDPAWAASSPPAVYGYYPSLAAASGVLMESCYVDYRHSLNTPECGPSNVTMRDCSIVYTLGGTGQSNATFEGRTEITGNFSGRATAANIYGRLIHEGVEQFRGSASYGPSIAGGSSAVTTVTVPGARTGDQRMYSASLSTGWGGLLADCAVTADDTVTVTIVNPMAAAISRPTGTLSIVGLR